MEWSPMTAENSDSILTIGCWDQTLSFYDIDGKLLLVKELKADPLAINYFSNGEFFVLGDNANKLSLWTKEGTYLGPVCEKKDWIWTSKVFY